MNARELLTRRLLAELPQEHEMTFDQAWSTWWMNPRAKGGFRLSRHGFDIMCEILHLDYWRIEIPKLSLANILALDRKLHAPYYIDQKRKDLVLFHSRDAVMVRLHGDVNRWIELLSARES